MNYNKPRKPTHDETEKLIDFCHEKLKSYEGQDMPRSEAVDTVKEGYIVIIDDYKSDDYSGKIMFVVWGFNVDLYELFIFNKDGSLNQIEPDYTPFDPYI